MDSSLLTAIILGFSAMAFLYASVGHGGASGYLALFILLGFAPSEVKIPVLLLNVLVATLSAIQFTRRGFFKWKSFLYLIILSVPMAFLGSKFGVSEFWLNLLLLFFLWYSAWVVWKGSSAWRLPVQQKWGLILIGGILGWISGMLGIGGGILLTPILIASNWGNSKEVSAQSAWFIVVNSLGGLAALPFSEIQLQASKFWMVFPLVMFMGFVGAFWGSGKGNETQLRRIMSIVLFLASLKLLFQTIGI